LKNFKIIRRNEIMRTIVITVSGGLIQSIENIPYDVRVKVKDYDTDSHTEEELLRECEKDEDGYYCESFWEPVMPDPERELSVVVGYIQHHHLLQGTYLNTIDKAIDIARAFIKKYPISTNWEELSYEETIEDFVKEQISNT
jgi:hypothetical protein